MTCPAAKPSDLDVLSLINGDNDTEFLKTELDIATPTPTTENDRNATSIVKATPTNDYAGQVQIFYDRWSVPKLFGDEALLSVKVPAEPIVGDVTCALNAEWGTTLPAEEFELLNIVDDEADLVAKADSFGYQGQVRVKFVTARIPLSERLTLVELNGFNYPFEVDPPEPGPEAFPVDNKPMVIQNTSRIKVAESVAAGWTLTHQFLGEVAATSFPVAVDTEIFTTAEGYRFPANTSQPGISLTYARPGETLVVANVLAANDMEVYFRTKKGELVLKATQHPTKPAEYYFSHPDLREADWVRVSVNGSGAIRFVPALNGFSYQAGNADRMGGLLLEHCGLTFNASFGMVGACDIGMRLKPKATPLEFFDVAQAVVRN